MFHQSSFRNSHNKSSKFKRIVQIALILTVVVWLINRINKNDHAGGDKMVRVNLNRMEDLNLGRKVKAGSENVVIIDGQKRDMDETPETSEAEDKSKGFHQHDDSFSQENVESPEVISNIGQAGTQDEQPGSKDGNDDLSSSGRDVTDLSSNDKEDILQLPSERDNENSLDQNERANVEGNSVSQSELITLEEEKNGNGEAITSEEERALRDNDQSEGREKTDGSENGSEVEKDEVDFHGEDKLETEGNSKSSSEVKKTETSKSHGGLESDPEGNGPNNLEGTTVKESSDDASLFLPKEENGESNESESLQKNIHDSQDVSIDAETIIRGTTKPVSSVPETKDEAKPNSNEETESLMQTEEEVPKREAVEFQDKGTSKTAENEKLPLINEALERDAIESNVDGAFDSGRDDSEEDALEPKEDGNQAENTSHDLENLETPIDEALHVEAAESLGDIISKDESTGDTVLEETTEPKPKEDNTSFESGNDNVTSGANDNTDILEDATELNSKEDATSELGKDNASSGGSDNIESQGENSSKEENIVPEDTAEMKPKADPTSRLEFKDADFHVEDLPKEENSSNTIFEVIAEPKHKEDTTSELGTSLASSDVDNAVSSNEGGKEIE